MNTTSDIEATIDTAVELAELEPDDREFAFVKLSKELRAKAKSMGPEAARFLVDSYYKMQHQRIGLKNQERAVSQGADQHAPTELLTWLSGNFEGLEDQVRAVLDVWTKAHPVGEWMRSVKGIGPVLSAGLLAYVDMRRATTAGYVWRMAGLDPSLKWLSREEATELYDRIDKASDTDSDLRIGLAEAIHRPLAWVDKQFEGWEEKDGVRGQKPRKSRADRISALCKVPHNRALKRLCFLIGECFMKVSSIPDAFYGRLYLERRARDWGKNMAGDYEAQAMEAAKRVSSTTDAWKWNSGCYTAKTARDWMALADMKARTQLLKSMQGEPGSGVHMLAPAHILMRAKRWTVKLFLAHWHHVSYVHIHGEQPPKPYAITHLGHAHEILPPNFVSTKPS